MIAFAFGLQESNFRAISRKLRNLSKLKAFSFLEEQNPCPTADRLTFKKIHGPSGKVK